MWTVIYITPSKQKAEYLNERLIEEGFLTKIKENQILHQYELLVPEGELDEIKEVISILLP